MTILSISSAPRDVSALQQLKRGQLTRLASQLHIFDDPDRQASFQGLTLDKQAVEVYNALVLLDQSGGTMAQSAPQAPAPQFQAPVAPPQVQEQPQFQAPPQFQQPQFQPPQFQAPPQFQPPVAPPQPQQPQFQAPTLPQPPQVQAPQQFQAPPQQFQPPQFQPPMAPQVLQQQYAQPQFQSPAPPAQVQQPMRQPQTPSDPNNTGSTAPMSQIVQILSKVIESQKVIASGVNAVNAGVIGSAQLQRVVLQVLLTLSELQGLDPDDIAKQVTYQDPDAVEKFIAKLSGPGKA